MSECSNGRKQITSNVLYELLLPENWIAYRCDWDFEKRWWYTDRLYLMASNGK